MNLRKTKCLNCNIFKSFSSILTNIFRISFQINSDGCTWWACAWKSKNESGSISPLKDISLVFTFTFINRINIWKVYCSVSCSLINESLHLGTNLSKYFISLFSFKTFIIVSLIVISSIFFPMSSYNIFNWN